MPFSTLEIEIEMEIEKPSRDLKFSSKTGAYGIIECWIVEPRLWEFIKKFKTFNLIENGSLSNTVESV